MQKLLTILLAGLAFLGLQVATLEAAEDCSIGTQCFDNKKKAAVNPMETVGQRRAEEDSMGAPAPFDDGLMGGTVMSPAPGMNPDGASTNRVHLDPTQARNLQPSAGYNGENHVSSTPSGQPMLDAGNAAGALAIDAKVETDAKAKVQECIVRMIANEQPHPEAYCERSFGQ